MHTFFVAKTLPCVYGESVNEGASLSESGPEVQCGTGHGPRIAGRGFSRPPCICLGE